MTPKIVETEPFALIGKSTTFIHVRSGDSNAGERIGVGLGLHPRLRAIPNRVNDRQMVGFIWGSKEERIDPTPTSSTTWPAPRVSQAESVPEGLTLREVPGGTYAVFEHHGRIEEIKRTVDGHLRWLAANVRVRTRWTRRPRVLRRTLQSPRSDDSVMEYWILGPQAGLSSLGFRTAAPLRGAWPFHPFERQRGFGLEGPKAQPSASPPAPGTIGHSCRGHRSRSDPGSASRWSTGSNWRWRGEKRDVPPRSRPHRLLCFLLLRPGESVSRSRAAGVLWPDSSESAARRRLSDAIYLLRQHLPEEAPAHHRSRGGAPPGIQGPMRSSGAARRAALRQAPRFVGRPAPLRGAGRGVGRRGPRGAGPATSAAQSRPPPRPLIPRAAFGKRPSRRPGGRTPTPTRRRPCGSG